MKSQNGSPNINEAGYIAFSDYVGSALNYHSHTLKSQRKRTWVIDAGAKSHMY